ncbi:hypothetical protein FRC12_019888 [Ceratobasidium sp. 428]|nr:hypothetical protein FRC12_019888 [Ceratobasidium sp. 428]
MSAGRKARYFKQMLRNAGHLDSVKKLKVKESNLAQYQKEYEASTYLTTVALQKLRDLYARTTD